MLTPTLSVGAHRLQATVTDSQGVEAQDERVVIVNSTNGHLVLEGGIDIGSPAHAGSLSDDAANNTYTLQGSGADIWHDQDQFHFGYLRTEGDFDIRARLASLTRTNQWAKAGVMMRKHLGPGSANVATLIMPDHGTAFHRRTEDNINSVADVYPEFTVGGWVRLQKQGNRISSYYATQGENWTKLGEIDAPFSGEYYVGLAVTSHDNSVLTRAVFEHMAYSPLNTTTQTQP